jgi:hypothetical protein
MNEPQKGLTAADVPFLEKMIRFCQGNYPEEDWDESFREWRTKHPEFGDKWLEKTPIHHQVMVWGGGWDDGWFGEQLFKEVSQAIKGDIALWELKHGKALVYSGDRKNVEYEHVWFPGQEGEDWENG